VTHSNANLLLDYLDREKNDRYWQGCKYLKISLHIKDDTMAYFLYQAALITTIAVIAGSIIGWWLHHFYGKQERQSSNNDLSLVKDYLAESIRENARLKIQLKQTEEKLEIMSHNDVVPDVKGVDFEAYQAFENTVKEAQMRKYLN